MSSSSFPTEPAQLTAEWLTRVLREAAAFDAGELTRFVATPVAAQGAAAVVVRVTLDYAGANAGAPASVVVKFATPHLPIRTVMHRFGFYRSEVEFYRQLGGDAGISTPHCYFADIDAESGCFVLVLEDMAPARPGDPLTPRVDDVDMAIDHLAAFHAHWWNSARLRELRWLAYPGTPAYHVRSAGVQQAFRGALGVVQSRLGEQFPATLARAADHMLSDWSAFIAARQTLTPTLLHRDFHAQQIFFPSEGGGRFAVFDWQTVGIGPGAEDLARIVSMGLTTAQRQEHDARMVARYHAGLVAAGVADYGLNQCRDQFRLGLSASLITNVVAAANLDPAVFEARESAAGVTMAYAIFERLARAFDRHEVHALLPGGLAGA